MSFESAALTRVAYQSETCRIGLYLQAEREIYQSPACIYEADSIYQSPACIYEADSIEHVHDTRLLEQRGVHEADACFIIKSSFC